VRDTLAALADQAGHSPSIEPIALLPPDIDEPAAAGKRPADVYLPHWWGHKPACIDVAITSALLPSRLTASAADPSAAARGYAAAKRAHAGTEAACVRAGMSFIPAIFEAEGGAGAEASAVLRELFADSARRSGIPQSIVAMRGRQRVSLALQQANAVALLRHRAPPAPHWAHANVAARADVAAANADAAARSAAASAAALPVAHPVTGAAPQQPPTGGGGAVGGGGGAPAPPPALRPPGGSAADPAATHPAPPPPPVPPPQPSAAAAPAPPPSAAQHRVQVTDTAPPAALLVAPGGAAGAAGLFVAPAAPVGGNSSPPPPPPPSPGGTVGSGSVNLVPPSPPARALPSPSSPAPPPQRTDAAPSPGAARTPPT
jgi:hypothetical protein